MRRLILILTGLLLGGTLTAQNLSRCEYWFDQDYAARQVVLYTGDSLPTQVDASSLSVGLHSLVLLVQDTGGTWSSPRSFMFLHYPTPQSDTAIYTYWFDQNHVDGQSGTLTSGNMLIDASMLTAGPHFLTMMCQMGSDIRVEQHLFYHFPDVASAPATYTCWFDQNYAAAQTDSLVNGTLTVDASSLPPGMHQFTVVCLVGNNSRVEQHIFYKMPNIAPVTLNYRVDGGQWTSVSAHMAGAVVNLILDMTALAEGNHGIEYYTTGGNNDVLTTIQIDTFERTHMPVHYTLTAVAADSTMGGVTGGGFWIENENVTITAIPADGYHFTHWNDGDTVNPRVVTLTSDTTFTAYFEADIHYYTLTVLSADTTMGSVSEGGTWAEGEEVTIEAFPLDGFHFTQWNDGDTMNPRIVLLTSDTTFIAYFEMDPTGIDDLMAEKIVIGSLHGNIIISLDTPKPLWVYDLEGRLLAHELAVTGVYAIPVPAGVYIVKAGEHCIRKVVVTE